MLPSVFPKESRSIMSHDIARLQSTSPFDEIRRVRADGSEYWSARDLQPLMGYEEWRNLQTAIQRARVALVNTDNALTSHVVEATIMVARPQGGSISKEDFQLSRHAAYLTAINGDPEKPETAAAQGYFATRTREAETARPDLSTLDGIRALCDQLEATARTAHEAKTIAVRSEARLDGIEGRHEWMGALAYARWHSWADTSNSTLSQFGSVAGRVGRSHGLSPSTVTHPLYGPTNGWPEWVWDKAAELFL